MLISGTDIIDAISSGIDVHQISAEYTHSEVISGINTTEETLIRGSTSLIQRNEVDNSVWNFTTTAGQIAQPEACAEDNFPTTVEVNNGTREFLYSTDLEEDYTTFT